MAERFLAQKPVNFISLTDSFIVSFSKLLKLSYWMQTVLVYIVLLPCHPLVYIFLCLCHFCLPWPRISQSPVALAVSCVSTLTHVVDVWQEKATRRGRRDITHSGEWNLTEQKLHCHVLLKFNNKAKQTERDERLKSPENSISLIIEMITQLSRCALTTSKSIQDHLILSRIIDWVPSSWQLIEEMWMNLFPNNNCA